MKESSNVIVPSDNNRLGDASSSSSSSTIPAKIVGSIDKLPCAFSDMFIADTPSARLPMLRIHRHRRAKHEGANRFHGRQIIFENLTVRLRKVATNDLVVIVRLRAQSCPGQKNQDQQNYVYPSREHCLSFIDPSVHSFTIHHNIGMFPPKNGVIPYYDLRAINVVLEKHSYKSTLAPAPMSVILDIYSYH